MKKFSKIKFLIRIGLLRKDFKDKKLADRTSFYLHVRSYFIAFICMLSFPKLYVSLFFDQNDETQIYIGNFFNFLDETPRFFFGVAGFITQWWFLSIFFAYNYLNDKKNKLFLLWLRMTNELYDEKGNEFEVVGLPVKDNREFWEKEDQFNYVYNRCYNVFLFATSALFSLPIVYYNHTDLDTFLYFFFIVFHFLNYSFFFFFHYHYTITLNVIFITTLIFLLKKIRFLAKTIECFSNKSVKIDNNKLNQLIFQWNRVHSEIVLINSYFSLISGVNFLIFLVIGILALFATLSTDLRTQFIMCSLLLPTFISVIYIPYAISNQLIAEMKKGKMIFQKISFNSTTSLINKKKINSISFCQTDEHFGFSCFDIFQMTSYNSYLVK